MTMDSAIQRLTAGDVPANVALARAVGWNDTDNDWRVLHEAAVVLGIRDGGGVIAQGALGLYRTAGSIAKMVVAPNFQRRGLGARLLDALLDEAERRSLPVLGLVATPFGQPLYEERRFETTGEVVVFIGTPERSTSIPPAESLDDAGTAASVDGRFIRCSRETMLRARYREARATSCVRDAQGKVTGYAMATAQGTLALVGPVIAESPADAERLALSLFSAVNGPVRIDVPAERVEFRNWLRVLGLVEQGARAEMALGADTLPWQVEQRFALASQAWG
jgi:GNAT superfamily N-acetyltransferase